LLLAVSHHLRAPLAAAKIAIEALRSPDIEFSHEDRRELLELAEENLTRVGRLAENLLDASRLQVGGCAVSPQAVNLAEVILRGIEELGSAGPGVRVHVPDDLPEV
jgi:two-component system sensor histidine kinase KdpD